SIENEFINVAKLINKEDSYLYIEKLKYLTIQDFDRIIKTIYKFIHSSEQAIIAQALKAIDLINKSGLTAQDFSNTNKGIYGYFTKLSEPVDKLKNYNPNSYVIKTIEQDNWTVKSVSADVKQRIDGIKADLKQFYLDLNRLIERYKPLMILKFVAPKLYSLAVLNEIKKLTEDIKTENNFILITEFNKILGTILQEPVPYIYERLGEKYKHFLIDEFQDTSLLQWANILPLIDNSLAEGFYNLIVGDTKQAIYRWRNGEFEQFYRLPELIISDTMPGIDDYKSSLKRNSEIINLAKNYRSKGEIVRFNNELFTFISEQLSDDYKRVYSDVNQEIVKEGGAYVEIRFFNKAQHSDYTQYNLNTIKELTDRLQKDKFEYKDIAILCRSNKNLSKISEYLIGEGIPIVSAESLLLKNSPAVSFLLACLSFIDNPANKIAEKEMLNYLVMHKGLKQLKENINIFELTEANGIDFKIYYLYKKPLFDICEHLLRLFGLNKDKANPAIIFFLDLINEFSAKSNNIKDFMEEWELKKDKYSIINPPELNAVRLSTIHKSKGLQYPVVIYAFADTAFSNTNKYFWVDLEKEATGGLEAGLINNNQELLETAFSELYNIETGKSLIDQVNMIYVAMTRAEERLYVLSGNVDTCKANSVTKLLYSFLSEKKALTKENLIFSVGEEKEYNLNKSDNSNKAGQTESVNLSNIGSYVWQQRVYIRTANRDIWGEELETESQRYGKLVHYILSKIIYSDEVNQTLEALFIQGYINHEEIIKLSRQLESLFSNAEIEKYFSRTQDYEILTEAEIIDAQGAAFRPDRLLINGKKAIIIDFKTGKENDIYTQQLDKYEKLLKDMGFDEIEKKIIYL
nr:UvrD-helicase domain-containing protein [Bacteroidales bacterium]